MNRKEIRVLLFSPADDAHSRKMEALALTLVSAGRFTRCSRLDELCSALQAIIPGSAVVVIFIRTREGMDRLTEQAARLKDHLLILILGSPAPDLVQDGFRLYPRYTTYMKDDFTDVFLVMEKMIARIENRSNGDKQ